MIPHESLESDLSDHDRELDAMRVELGSLHADRDWLLHVGVIHVMDKLIEHLEFTGGVSRTHHVAFVAGEESGKAGLKVEIDARTYDPEGSDSV